MATLYASDIESMVEIPDVTSSESKEKAKIEIISSLIGWESST